MDNENINEEVIKEPVKVRKVNIGPIIGISVAVVVLIFIASILFTYNRFINSPVKIFEKAINSLYDEFHNSLKDAEEQEKTYFNLEEESINIEADIKLDGSFMNFNQLKDNVFKVNCGLDYKNDLITIGANILENNTDLVNGTIYLKNKDFFLESNLLKNIYKGNLEEDVFEPMEIEEIYSYSITDIDNTVKKLKDALINSLDEKSMTKSKETINIDDDKIDTNKIAYKLDKESTKKLFSSISQIILEDKDLQNNLSKILEIKKEDLIKTLKDFQDDEFYKDFTEEDNMEIAIYTTRFTYKFVKFEIVQKDTEIEYINYKETNKFIINDITNNDIFEINCKSRNVDTITITNNKKQIAEFIIKENTDEKLNIEYDINDDEIKMDGNVIMELKTNTETEASGSVIINCNINSNTGKEDLKIDYNYKILVGTKIEDHKFDNAIDINEFKDEDIKKMEEVLTNIENSNLYKYFTSINTSSSLNNPTI